MTFDESEFNFYHLIKQKIKLLSRLFSKKPFSNASIRSEIVLSPAGVPISFCCPSLSWLISFLSLGLLLFVSGYLFSSKIWDANNCEGNRKGALHIFNSIFFFCSTFKHTFIHLPNKDPASTLHLIRSSWPNLAKCSFYLGPDRGDLTSIFYARLH